MVTDTEIARLAKETAEERLPNYTEDLLELLMEDHDHYTWDRLIREEYSPLDEDIPF